MEWWRKFQQGGGLPGMFGAGGMAGSEFVSANPHTDTAYSGPSGLYAPPQDDLDFRKEFAQSMFGAKKPSGQDSIGRLAIGGGMRRFETNPLQVAPEVSQFAPNPGWSLMRPLKKKNWYDYYG